MSDPEPLPPPSYFAVVRPEFLCVRCGATLGGAGVVCGAPACVKWARDVLSDG